MRVLRAELGIGLGDIKSLLSKVVAGAHTGTMPEMEFLAHRLRASGIDAAAARP
ncbi:hypothetical protein ACWFQ8_14185 [Streptomyces sp. NPDC055254]